MQRRWLRHIWMCTTSSSWPGPSSTWATALPLSSPGPPVGTNGTQVWAPGRVSLLVLLGHQGMVVHYWLLGSCQQSHLLELASPKLEGQFCNQSVFIVWVTAGAKHWPRDWHGKESEGALGSLLNAETEPFGDWMVAERGRLGTRAPVPTCLSKWQIFSVKEEIRLD